MKKLIVILIAMLQFLPSGSTQEYSKWELPEGARTNEEIHRIMLTYSYALL